MSYFSKKLIPMNSSSLGTTSARLKGCGPIRLVCILNARKYDYLHEQGKQFWTKYVETFKEYVRKYGCVKDLIKKVSFIHISFYWVLLPSTCSIVIL